MRDGCSGPQDCPRWKDVQHLIARAAPFAVGARELQLTYRAKEYDARALALFSDYREVLVYSVRALSGHHDDFEKIAVKLTE